MFLKLRSFIGQDYAVGNIPQNRFCASPTISVEINNDNPPPETNFITPILSTQELKITSKAQALKANSLEELRQEMANFSGISFKNSALNLVFGKGNPQSKIMLIGEAPGAEEDKQGLPFVGAAGQLLDKMLASINLDLTQVYVTNILVWRPPGNRTPTPQEVSLMLPFLHRHIELVNPEIIVTLGGVATAGLLEKEISITRARGIWQNITLGAKTYAVLPTFHPAYLLRSPLEKRKAWQDLQSLQQKIESM
jgi:DNA polymerase